MPHETPQGYLHANLTKSMLAAAIRVQNTLGPGLLEKPYRHCLAHALRQAGHGVAMETSLALAFDGLLVPDAYRLDLLVDDKGG
jgi:GxxExxY protein